MSKEYDEYGTSGKGINNREIRQTLNGVRRLAGNNPIADVLEFRKEYTVVDVSKRNGPAALAGSGSGGQDGEVRWAVHGSRPAWSRGNDANIRLRYGRHSGEMDAEAWPERPGARKAGGDPAAKPITMMDTIRVARAFFGQTGADEPDEESVATTVEPAGAAASDAELAENSGQGAVTCEVGEEDEAPAVAAGSAQNAEAATAGDETTGDVEIVAADDGDDLSTDRLLDEIACEIVEDALVEMEDDEPEHGDAPDGGDDIAEQATLDLLAEDVEKEAAPADDDSEEMPETTEPVLIVDDVAQVVMRPHDDNGTVAEPELPEKAGGTAPTPERHVSAGMRSATVALRRGRRPGPRLPVDSLAPSRSETIARLESATRAIRDRGQPLPKWSESARHHMTDMLASTPREPLSPAHGRIGIELPRIDNRPERHRQSSAMLLLGLPAMLLIGFGGAYIYHASNYDPTRVFDEARSAIPASIASVPTISKPRTPSKISESIIQKQEAKAAAPATSGSMPLPPPVAPPVAGQAENAAPQPASLQTPSTTLTKVESGATPSLPQPESVSPPVQRAEQARIEPAAAAVTSALSVAPVEPEGTGTLLPAPIAPQPAAPEPVAAEPAAPAPEAEAPVAAAPLEPQPAEIQIGKSARADAAPKRTQLASLMPAAQPLPEETGEAGQLIARGNERLEIGDISAARLLFELAAQGGSAVAATAMGRSYDPVYFMRAGVRGVKPDPTKAREWYEKALAGGDTTAEDDLRNMAAWLAQQ